MNKILIIEDEELLRQSTRFALQRKGYEMHEAADGAAGIEMARRILPDLIICDINMDRMDGYAVLEAVRHDPATATVPFILMTGMGDPETMRRGMNLGADDYLDKPFTSAQLYSAVVARLKKTQVMRETAERKLADLRTNLSLALPHEMITPLNGIFGLAQLLSTEAASLTPEEVAEYGTNILESAERLHRTVRNFVLYGQLELQASDAAAVAALGQAVTATVAQVIESRARHIAHRAGRADDLRLDLAEGAVAVGLDLLTSLVEALLENAFKFSPARSEVFVSAKRSDTAYVVAITDHGLGMEPAQIAQIGAYAQFNRRQNEQQGSGLGLAIARRIVELHGGQLTITSQKGQGTTVTICLPLGVLSP